MIETMTASICINAFTVAASAVADATCTPKNPHRKVVGAPPADPMAHKHKDTAHPVEPDLPELVSMADVRTDGGTQARMTINETVVKDYADALEAGVKLPPVVLYYDESTDVHWLADGFHRFEAHRMIGRVAISAFVKDGTQREAMLHAAGANATHGLPRTREDKRCAVTMLLQDREWAQWSDNAIAKACHVSNHLVADIRASLTWNSPSETPAERTYITKHGTAATMQTAKVGKSKPTTPATRSDADALPTETDPEMATPCMKIEKDVVAEVSRTELLIENAASCEEVVDPKAELAELPAENEQMGSVFQVDDGIKAELAEVTRIKMLAENAERTPANRSLEFDECARNLTYWRNRAEKAETLLANAESTDAPCALRDENTKLRAENSEMHTRLQDREAQLGDLGMMLQEAMVCHGEMRAFLEAVPLTGMSRQLHQALEVAWTLESRVAGAPGRHTNAQSAQDGDAQSAADGATLDYKSFVKLNAIKLFEGQPSTPDTMAEEMVDDRQSTIFDLIMESTDDEQAAEASDQ